MTNISCHKDSKHRMQFSVAVGAGHVVGRFTVSNDTLKSGTVMLEDKPTPIVCNDLAFCDIFLTKLGAEHDTMCYPSCKPRFVLRIAFQGYFIAVECGGMSTQNCMTDDR